MTLAPGSLKDMAGVAINGVVRKADKYVADGTNPKLVGFTYTIDATATLVLEFDEPMLKSSLVVKEITLQDAKIAHRQPQTIG